MSATKFNHPYRPAEVVHLNRWAIHFKGEPASRIVIEHTRKQARKHLKSILALWPNTKARIVKVMVSECLEAR